MRDLNLTGWNVSRVLDMKFMFEKSSFSPDYRILNLSNWTLSGMTDVEGLFHVRRTGEKVSVQELDLSNWNNERLHNLDFFNKIKYIQKLKVTNWKKMDELLAFLNEFSKEKNTEIIGVGFKTKDVEELTYSSIPKFTYTGKQIKPSVEIYDGEYKLLEGTDYEIDYGDNINIYDGTVSIKGKKIYNKEQSQYIGEKYISFEIVPAKLQMMTPPKVSALNRGEHLSSAIISGGKIVDHFGIEVEGEWIWDWNNIENQMVYNDRSYRAYFHKDNYESLYFDFEVKTIKLNGWVKENNLWSYYRDDIRLTGLQEIDNTWFHMDSNGYMQTGWQKLNNNWFYMNNSGHMQTGWVQAGGNWFYMNAMGHMQTGWVQAGGNWFYMNASGHMQTGWVQAGGNWFYMNPSGHMQTGWVQAGGNWFYMNASGHMQTGWTQVANYWYYMNASGHMQTGWLKLGSDWYYLNDNGRMQNQNKTIKGKYYRFSSSGRLL